jgi:hypothetical protein
VPDEAFVVGAPTASAQSAAQTPNASQAQFANQDPPAARTRYGVGIAENGFAIRSAPSASRTSACASWSRRQAVSTSPRSPTSPAAGARPSLTKSAYVRLRISRSPGSTPGRLRGAPSIKFARLYERVREGRHTPSQVYAADEGAVTVTESLIRDAGFEPVPAGGLDAARALEDAIGLVFAIGGQRGPFFLRIGGPEEL